MHLPRCYQASRRIYIYIYRYGFDLLVFSLLNITLLFFLGLVIGRADVVMFILLGYIPLQSLGGGYHAKTHLRCAFITFFEMSLALVAVEFIGVDLLAVGACFCMVSIFLLAPVQHPNAPFGAAFAKRMKCFVRVFATVLFIALIFTLEEYPVISSCIAISLILSGISLCAATVKSKYMLN